MIAGFSTTALFLTKVKTQAYAACEHPASIRQPEGLCGPSSRMMIGAASFIGDCPMTDRRSLLKLLGLASIAYATPTMLTISSASASGGSNSGASSSKPSTSKPSASKPSQPSKPSKPSKPSNPSKPRRRRPKSSRPSSSHRRYRPGHECLTREEICREFPVLCRRGLF